MGEMTGAMRDALELIRSLKKQYPDETEDQLISRFQKELEDDRALKRALMRDVFNGLLQKLSEREPPNSKV
jgi:2-polyprenyl-6-methoxyphenol hydroxylase-like FAD-dependent oxidoreductase